MIATLCLTLLCSWFADVPSLCETLGHATEGPSCASGTIEGTDAWYECQTGAPIDLTPIQDEADTLTSQRRN